MVSAFERKQPQPHSKLDSTTSGGAVVPGAEQVDDCVVWNVPFDSMDGADRAMCYETDESSGSSANLQSEEESYSRTPEKPFWKVNKKAQSAPDKVVTEEACSVDSSPDGIESDLECGEESFSRRGAVSFTWLVLGASLLVIFAIGIAAGVSMIFIRGQSGTTSSGSDSSGNGSSAPISTFDGICDVSTVEMLCRNDDERELEPQEIPKCIQDGFDVVYVRAGHDAYYQLNSMPSLKSCSNQGMALKRIAAREYEQPTTGMLDCELSAYSWYYEYGEVEWWSENGSFLTNFCEQDYVKCTAGNVVESFVTEMGEECMVSMLSL